MLLVGGDSFTAITHHHVWHDFIQQKQKKINIAWHSAGNFYIADTIQKIVRANPSRIKKVIIFWSQFHRLDIIIDKPINMFHRKTSSGYWQFSGGIDNDTKEWKQVFEKPYKSKGWDNIINASINEVQKTHNLLESCGVNYNFGFVYPDEKNNIFSQNKNFIPLIFYQWTKENNLQGADGHHPSEEGHRLFADAISKYINT